MSKRSQYLPRKPISYRTGGGRLFFFDETATYRFPLKVRFGQNINRRSDQCKLGRLNRRHQYSNSESIVKIVAYTRVQLLESCQMVDVLDNVLSDGHILDRQQLDQFGDPICGQFQVVSFVKFFHHFAQLSKYGSDNTQCVITKRRNDNTTHFLKPVCCCIISLLGCIQFVCCGRCALGGRKCSFPIREFAS